MISAFGVDHGGEISKRKRSTKDGALVGAGVGTVAGAALAGDAARRLSQGKSRDAARVARWAARPRYAKVGGVALATGLAGATGAGVGAAVGRKKRKHIEKSMSPGKLKALSRQAMKNTAGLTSDRTGKSGYATQRLKAYNTRDDLDAAREARGRSRLIQSVHSSVNSRNRKKLP